MTFVLAGLVAAGLSWLLNGLLVDKVGRLWVIAIGPGFEELFKTGAALLLGANIFLSHLAFGAVEAMRDMAGRQPGSVPAGLASFTGHSLFGFLAALSYGKTESTLPAVAVPLAVHFLWNGGVVLLRSRLTGRK